MTKIFFTLVFANLFLAFSVTAGAITISYEVTDLPDTTSGEDTWEYTYRVSDYTFTEKHGFTIYFDQTLYKNIQVSQGKKVNEDWDIIVWQPDIAIPDAGAYDALAIPKDDVSSLAEVFTVSFVWLGNGTPGPQRFEVYAPNFDTLESGLTISAPINPWDVNGDNTVDILDLLSVGRQFGATPPDKPAADINGDGTVDISDLVLIGRHFGESYVSTAPAPMASMLTRPGREKKIDRQF